VIVQLDTLFQLLMMWKS